MMAVWSTTSLSRVRSYDRIDGEYFLPEYLANDAAMSQIETFALPDRFAISDGNHMTVSCWFSSDGDVPYYRGQDVNDFFLENARPIRIPQSVYDSPLLRRSHFKEGDVLLSIVGTIGSLSVVPKGFGESTGSCKIAILRAKDKHDAYAVAAFLMTNFGQLQIKRNTRGAIQMGLILRDLGKIRVPLFADDVKQAIDGLVRKAIKKNHESNESYSAAVDLLATSFKLDTLRFERPLSYTANFSDVMAQGRADADYFQIPYAQVHSHLDRFEWRPLSQLVDFVKGVEVGSDAYENSGKLFLRVSNVTERGLKYNTSDKYIGRKLYDQLRDAFEPQVGELLLTKDGTPGVCWVVDQPVEGIVSGALVRLVPKQKGVPQEYLALAINSILCRMQVEQNASGALILHWKLPLIKKLRVPLCDQDVMKRIATLVKESKKQHYKSVALLEEAKARVEQLIEEAANRA